jgi:hypothetical protein
MVVLPSNVTVPVTPLTGIMPQTLSINVAEPDVTNFALNAL